MEQEIAATDVRVDPKLQSSLAAEDLLNGAIDSTVSRDAQLVGLEKFIDGLQNLNTLDKYWARSDAEQLLAEGQSLQELQKKYVFYDHAGKIRNSICKRAPDGKGGTVCNLIDDEILNVDSGTRDRKWKLDALLKIQTQLNKYFQEKNIAPFVKRQKSVAENTATKILLVLDVEFRETFGAFQEKMGAPRFWELQQAMSPGEFPNFTTAFNFRQPQDFLKKLTRENLLNWPPKLVKSLLYDAEELILDEEVFGDKKDVLMRELRNLGKKSVADLVARLLELKEYRNRQIPIIEREKEKNAERKKKQEDNVKKEEEKKEENVFVKRRREDEEKEKCEKEKKETDEKKKKESETPVRKLETSADKQKVIDFYDKSIEHAERVLEECGRLGIPDSDPVFWSNAGVKNRQQWLKDHNMWDEYVKYNRNDKNIPSKAAADGFRFRWLNVNTGSRINGGSAESGMRYLNRYKESGYAIAAMGSGLSLDYTGSSSECLDPRRFMEKVQAAKSKIMGGSAAT